MASILIFFCLHSKISVSNLIPVLCNITWEWGYISSWANLNVDKRILMSLPFMNKVHVYMYFLVVKISKMQETYEPKLNM